MLQSINTLTRDYKEYSTIVQLRIQHHYRLEMLSSNTARRCIRCNTIHDTAPPACHGCLRTAIVWRLTSVTLGLRQQRVACVSLLLWTLSYAISRLTFYCFIYDGKQLIVYEMTVRLLSVNLDTFCLLYHYLC